MLLSTCFNTTIMQDCKSALRVRIFSTVTLVSIILAGIVIHGGTGGVHALSSSPSTSTIPITSLKPILVVGATGKVGRLVVQQLLGKNQPVRALVRNPAKAQELFGTSTTLPYPPLEIVVADLGRYDECEDVLERAVQGCSSIISVSGTIRFSKWTDFVPWRLFRPNVSAWAGRDHPYYANYLAQKKLIELAEKHHIQRFVRLTGLSLAYPAFGPIPILFNALLSLSSRYGILCEQALGESTVPYVILRPGGLAENERIVATTNIQIDPSGKLPFPGRIGRRDVADLCVQACHSLTPSQPSYTLACRWCGTDVLPKPQGRKSDGYSSAAECLRQLVQSNATSPAPRSTSKPYGLAVAMVVYPLMFLAAKGAFWLWSLLLKLLRG